MRKEIKCIVAGFNPEGCADLYFVKVECTEDQEVCGSHIAAARKQAIKDGWEAPVIFDEYDHAGKAMLPLFVWESASVIKI
jgi:hypothetical protein